MSDRPVNVDRVFELAGAICDASASADDLVELDSLVVADETSRRNYWDYCWIHVSLRTEARLHRALWRIRERDDLDSAALTPWESDTLGAMMSPVASAPCFPTHTFLSTALHGTIGFFSQELPFSLLIATVLTSLGLWAASMVYVSSPDKIAKDSSPPVRSSFDPTLNVVGKITGMVNCKWTDPDTETFNSANVLLGRKYALASGLMEITYDTGAKVILQGPVTYQVEANGGYLSVGKLTGKLGKKAASGQSPVASATNPKSRNPEISKSPDSNPQSLIPNPFVIYTPTASIIDIGTEFGVEVHNANATDVRVFSGRVRIDSKQTTGVAIPPHYLTAGQIVRVGTTGIQPLTSSTLHPIPILQEKFLSKVFFRNFEHGIQDMVLTGTACLCIDPELAPNGILRLTSNRPDQWGSVWYRHKQSVASGFSTEFRFRLSRPNLLGGNGLALVIQNAHAGCLLTADERGLPRNALNVSFTNHRRGYDFGKAGVVAYDGNRQIAFGGLTTINGKADICDGAIHTARVDYSPGMLRVCLDGKEILSNVQVNLTSLTCGSAADAEGKAWIGLTAGTQGAVVDSDSQYVENHDIVTWRFLSKGIHGSNRPDMQEVHRMQSR